MATFETVRVEDAFAEIGRITHEGTTFDAMGAVETDGALFGYVSDDARTLTNWDGSVSFGRIVRTTNYKVRTGFGCMPIRMSAIRVRRPDGSLWSGRYGSDWRTCVTVRPIGR